MATGERMGEFLRRRRGWTAAFIGAALALVAVVLFAACPAGSVPADSGLQGSVWLGPLSPVQQLGGPTNERSYAATLEVLGPDNRIVTTVRSDRGGRFRVNLAPGAYVLQGVSGSNGFPHASPVSLVVAAHRFTTVQLSFDTGIR
jgi:hypothetical protein